ncbi:MAG: DUF167 domain-containing protein [Chloroflexi bacterium]|nr:DUF167 domain-containing protein [Chloroflexota bacterium]
MSSARLVVRVTPRSSRDHIEVSDDGAWRAWLTAPPFDGKANDALVRLLARRLGVPQRDVRVVRGQSGRDKVVEVDGLDEAEVARRLRS